MHYRTGWYTNVKDCVCITNDCEHLCSVSHPNAMWQPPFLQECPCHNEEYQTIHLMGTLEDILGDGSPWRVYCCVVRSWYTGCRVWLRFIHPLQPFYHHWPFRIFGPYTDCIIKIFQHNSYCLLHSKTVLGHFSVWHTSKCTMRFNKSLTSDIYTGAFSPPTLSIVSYKVATISNWSAVSTLLRILVIRGYKISCCRQTKEAVNWIISEMDINISTLANSYVRGRSLNANRLSQRRKHTVTYPGFAWLIGRVLDLMIEFIGPLYNWLQQFTNHYPTHCHLLPTGHSTGTILNSNRKELNWTELSIQSQS
jgi:hypothetical protein